MSQKARELIRRVAGWWQARRRRDEQTRANRKEAWYFVGLLFAGSFLTGFGFFLVRNVSPFFTVVIVIGILCYGFSCLGLGGLKKLLQSETTQEEALEGNGNPQ